MLLYAQRGMGINVVVCWVRISWFTERHKLGCHWQRGFTVKAEISRTEWSGRLSINQKLTKRPIRLHCSLNWQHPAPISRVQAGVETCWHPVPKCVIRWWCEVQKKNQVVKLIFFWQPVKFIKKDHIQGKFTQSKQMMQQEYSILYTF